MRLPVVITSVDEDAHRVNALLDLGSDERLAEGAARLAVEKPDAVMWACTSGSFVFGPDGARDQVSGGRDRGGCSGLVDLDRVRRRASTTSASAESRSPRPTPTTWPGISCAS